MADESRTESTPTCLRAIPWDYFALAFAISWALWGVCYFLAKGSPVVEGATEDLLAAAPPAFLVLVLLGVFGPFTAAFVLTGLRQGKPGVAALWKSGWTFKMPPVWWLVCLCFFPGLWAISLLISGAGVSFEAWTTPLKLLGLALFMYFLGGSFGEEFGWRGYALPRLLDGFSALYASVILGIFWVLWHLPLFFIPGSPQAQLPFWPWAVQVVSLAIIYTWVHVHVKGIVFAALLLHTTGNLSHELFHPIRDTGMGWTGAEGIHTIALIVAAVLVVLIFGPKRFRRE